jgi:transposase InsO family protein
MAQYRDLSFLGPFLKITILKGGFFGLMRVSQRESDQIKHWPEFTARAVRNWLGRIRVKAVFIDPASPWGNGYNESFNGKLRDEMLNREIFYNLREAQCVWRDALKILRWISD